MGEFGDKFRKAREKKGISFDDASKVTKIGTRMLQAIEEENFDRLPGGVFNKGFIRAYAKHLGLNEEDAITSYLACVQKKEVDAHRAPEPEPSAESRSNARRKRRSAERDAPSSNSQLSTPVEELPQLQLPRAEHVRPRRNSFSDSSSRDIPWGILAVAAIVIILAIILWIRRSHSPRSAAAGSATPQPAQSAPAPASASPTNPPPQTLPGAVTSPRSPAQTSAQPPGTPAATSHPAPAVPKSSPADNSGDATVPTSAKANPKSSETSAPTLTLLIRATETSWISITADGQPVSRETLIAPAHTSVRARREIVAKVGNAAGVTFLFNGQEIPADGAESEVKTFTFDSTGMRVAPAPQPAQN